MISQWQAMVRCWDDKTMFCQNFLLHIYFFTFLIFKRFQNPILLLQFHLQSKILKRDNNTLLQFIFKAVESNGMKIWQNIFSLYGLGLNRTGHMSFLTGQDQTPKFAGQVRPGQTVSGLIFLTFNLTRMGYQFSYDKIPGHKFGVK